MMRLLLALAEGTVAVLVLCALLIGPFLLLRFDYAVYVAGAALVAGIAFIYWPRKATRDDDPSSTGPD